MSDNANTPIVDYGTWSVEDAESEGGEYQKEKGNSFLKLSAGKHKLRLLPPMHGNKSPLLRTWQHFLNLPNGEMMVFTCPAKHLRKPCFACNHASALAAEGDRNGAWDFYPGLRVYSWVIQRGNEEMGPQVYPFGKKIYEGVLELRKNEDIGGNISSPEDDGLDIIVVREGSTKNDTEYKVFADRYESALSDDPDQASEWLGMCEDLRSFIRYPGDTDAMEFQAAVPMVGMRNAGGGGGGPRTRRALPVKPAPTVKEKPKRARGAGLMKKPVDADIEVVDDDDVPY